MAASCAAAVRLIASAGILIPPYAELAAALDTQTRAIMTLEAAFTLQSGNAAGSAVLFWCLYCYQMGPDGP